MVAIAHIEQYIKDNPCENAQSILKRARNKAGKDRIVGSLDVIKILGHDRASQLFKLMMRSKKYLQISAEHVSQHGMPTKK